MLSRAIPRISTPYLTRALSTTAASPAPAATAPAEAPAAAPSPTAAAEAPAAAPASDTPSANEVHGDRLHSTDIAFKPNSDGWGFSRQYASKFDTIFKTNITGGTEDSTAVTTSQRSKRSTLFDGGTKTDANLANLKAQILALPLDQRRRLLDELSWSDPRE